MRGQANAHWTRKQDTVARLCSAHPARGGDVLSAFRMSVRERRTVPQFCIDSPDLCAGTRPLRALALLAAEQDFGIR